MNTLPIRMGFSMFVGAALTFVAAPARAGHTAEGIVERIEDQTDELFDLMDDDFERSPDYRRLVHVARQLERIGDNLEEAVDDEDVHAAFTFLASLESELHCLRDAIAVQQACWIRPQSIHRALCLTREIHSAAHELQEELRCHHPVVRLGYGTGRVEPRVFEPRDNRLSRRPVIFGQRNWAPSRRTWR